MGCAPIAHALWGTVMNYDPKNPKWVLSAMLQLISSIIVIVSFFPMVMRAPFSIQCCISLVTMYVYFLHVT